MLRLVRRAVTTLLLGCLLWALGLVVAAPAAACSCADQTVQQYVERADAVFTGSLVSREEPGGAVVSSADPAVHVFAVDTVYKGTARESQEVLSPASGATCGLELTGEGPFVVFATRDADLGGTPFATPADHQYVSLLCDGSGPTTPELEAELTALAPPDRPRAFVPDEVRYPDIDASPARPPLWPLLVVVGAVAILGRAVQLGLRRRRP
jgi:hypothetical protein